MALHVAFLHNLQTCLVPEQAEFDTPETVEAIKSALIRLGHRVTLVEASVNPANLATRLESLAPDLVLNTAEGHKGKGREGFFPGLLEQLGLPYTGWDAYACTLTLDKHLTKLMLAERGVRTPASHFVTRPSQLKSLNLKYPLIVKPNFEGSSKGITQSSVAEDSRSLARIVSTTLLEYPSGLLIEEFIQGEDVTVPYLETLGVLEPARYIFGGPERKYAIYDYDMKQHHSHDVCVVCPTNLAPETLEELGEFTRKTVDILNLRDFARVDYRVTDTGQCYLIEVNALPSLEPGASIYLSAAQRGLDSIDAVLNSLVESALKRQKTGRRKKPRKKLVVGVAHNLKRGEVSTEDDSQAEFDSRDTIEALLAAIERSGYEARAVEATADFPARLDGVDLVFNIAEGFRGRNRESQVPALLELMGYPYTGSDATTMAITLDKALAKSVVSQTGVATPPFVVWRTAREKLPGNLRFPLFVKPLAEGSSKGIRGHSGIIEDEKVLREVAARLIKDYQQPALIEEYLPGREFTVGVLGTAKLRVLPPMEILFSPSNEARVYAFEHKLKDNAMVSFQAPADVSPDLFRRLEKVSRKAFRALGCRDVARIDLRLDGKGRVHFIECNPLPGLSPGFSDMCVVAEAAGMSYDDLVGEILTPAVRRLRAQRKARLSETSSP